MFTRDYQEGLHARHHVFKVGLHFQALKGRVVLTCNDKKTDLCYALGRRSFVPAGRALRFPFLCVIKRHHFVV